MFFVFQSGSEFVKIKLDRVNKSFELATSKSNYRFIPQPFWKLFGNPKKTLTGVRRPTEEESRAEMLEMEGLTDEKFRSTLVDHMREAGYTLRKCQY